MPTIRQIANAAQVSPMTVSFVLNNKPGQVSDETRERVLRVVREMGYRPRAATGRHRTPDAADHVTTLGVASGTEAPGLLTSGYYPSILSGLMVAADRHSQNLTLFASSLFHADPAQSIRTYCDGRCDGLFVIAPGPGSPLVSALRERGVPCVLLGDRGDEPCASVDLDNHGEARRVTEWLIAQGHRRMGFIGFPGRFVRSAQEREEGYAAALTAHGLPVDPRNILNSEWKDPAIYGGVMELARRPRAERPTALVCWNDRVAFQTMLVLSDAGLRVPHDVSVTGFDDDSVAAAAHPPLTTIRQPYQEIGDNAVDMLRELIAMHPSEREPRRVLLPGELIVRGSVAPCRENMPSGVHTLPPAPRREGARANGKPTEKPQEIAAAALPRSPSH
jgi:LacI family transcriptional regulator